MGVRSQRSASRSRQTLTRSLAGVHRARILGLPSADAADHGPDGRPCPRRRGGRLRRHRRHGPPRPAAGGGLADVRGDDHQHVARRPDRARSASDRWSCATRSGIPAVLAREAVTLDHASGGRFELGIGWGSVVDEMRAFGVGSLEPKERLSRLRESLEIMKALWAGETLDYEGEHFHAARCAATAGARSGRSRSSSAGPAREPCAWWPPTRTGGTCTPASSTGWTRCDRSRGTPAARSRCRWRSSRLRARARRSRRRPAGVSGRPRSSAPAPSSWITSGRSGAWRRARLRVVLRLRPSRHAGGLR